MADKYKNFADLSKHEKEGRDFAISLRERGGTPVVIAPHGGGIEPGTSELAEAIAGEDFAFYSFEGTKSKGNLELHITSTNFDEPLGQALVVKSPKVIAIHGEGSDKPIVYLGGLDTELGRHIYTALKENGFRVETDAKTGLQGQDPANICNKGTIGRGVQLEISNGLRKTFFPSFSREDRRKPTEEFRRFVAAVRQGVVNAERADPVQKPAKETK